MAEFRKPDPLSFDGNVSENWRQFEQDFDVFLQAAHGAKSKKEQAYILLNIAGRDAIEKSRSFTYKPAVVDADNHVITPAESREDIDILRAKFAEMCSPQKNVIIERHRFYSRFQKPAESFQSFSSELRTLAKTCEFDKVTPDQLIRDRIVCGVSSGKLRETFLNKRDLTLRKAIEIGQVAELTSEHSKTLRAAASANGNASDLHEIKQHDNRRRYNHGKPRYTGKPKTTRPEDYNKSPGCKNCGESHPKDKCKAYGKACSYCQTLNHFAKVCFKKKRQQQQQPQQYGQQQQHRKTQRIHDVSDEDDMDDQEYMIETISLNDSHDTPNVIHTYLDINGHEVNIKVDSGAKCNVLPHRLLHQIGCATHLNTRSQPTLKAYGGSTIPTGGVAVLECISAGQSYRVEFKIVQSSTVPILGCADAMRMNLLTVNEQLVHMVDSTPPELEKYADLFDDKLGCLPVKYKMTLDSKITPVVRPPRRVPKPMEEKVKRELKRMTALGVITPVTEPTEWVSQMVSTRKKSSEDIRLCIDPKDLNMALKRPHHPMRTVEETIMNLTGAKFFSVLDARTSFWQVPLDHQSSMLTTFNTPTGRMRFLRMPYGINSGSEVFQRTMETLFHGYPCEIIVDDLLIYGKDIAEHDANLDKVLNRAREVNLKLNKNKCKFRQNQVAYVGHLITDEGVKPDPSKIAAINEIQTRDCSRATPLLRYDKLPVEIH